MSKKEFEQLKFRLTKQLVEQCIGRVRRHKEDYGIVMLCDWRYRDMVRKETTNQCKWNFQPYVMEHLIEDRDWLRQQNFKKLCEYQGQVNRMYGLYEDIPEAWDEDGLLNDRVEEQFLPQRNYKREAQNRTKTDSEISEEYKSVKTNLRISLIILEFKVIGRGYEDQHLRLSRFA